MASAYKSDLDLITVYGDTGACPTSLVEMGVASAGLINSKYVQSIGLYTTYPSALCAFEFTFNSSGMNASVAGKN